MNRQSAIIASLAFRQRNAHRRFRFPGSGSRVVSVSFHVRTGPMLRATSPPSPLLKERGDSLAVLGCFSKSYRLRRTSEAIDRHSEPRRGSMFISPGLRRGFGRQAGPLPGVNGVAVGQFAEQGLNLAKHYRANGNCTFSVRARWVVCRDTARKCKTRLLSPGPRATACAPEPTRKLAYRRQAGDWRQKARAAGRAPTRP